MVRITPHSVSPWRKGHFEKETRKQPPYNRHSCQLYLLFGSIWDDPPRTQNGCIRTMTCPMPHGVFWVRPFAAHGGFTWHPTCHFLGGTGGQTAQMWVMWPSWEPACYVLPKIEMPQMDGVQWKTILKWMIWGKTHYFRKHPYRGNEILPSSIRGSIIRPWNKNPVHSSINFFGVPVMSGFNVGTLFMLDFVFTHRKFGEDDPDHPETWLVNLPPS